ncbi:M56 family metallopeptidase [Sphingobacterium gobiense]|uniref:Energy transducer TonB n=1 Tax=Sphingobacterium gobiense TaxID=1382456 RepID=A0A2S9JI84_9SPHI|nr:M56 family metallopeptidase [Sphingobacterium gobiense]PRD52686.1 energy transducer TonB [Sphingobacterium gobiense]
MTYLILANLSLMLFFGIYILVLKRLTFFQWNRIYLLSAIVVSFAIPLLQFVDLSHHREVYRPLAMIDFAEMDTVSLADEAAHNHSWSPMDWVRLVYIAGAGLMLLWLGIRLYRVLSAFGGNISEHRSFSFFNRVFIAEDMQRRDVIASHERIHIKQGHSYDILFLEVVRVFNWFNPIFYFYLKELKFQHECIADEACARDKVTYAELLVSNAMRVSRSVLVHEFSNKSFLKQRIMMLFKNKSKKINRISYMMILPALLLISGVAVAFNVSIRDTMEAKIEHLEQLENISPNEPLTSLNEVMDDITQQRGTTKRKVVSRSGEIIPKGSFSQAEHQRTVAEVTIVPQQKEDTARVFTAVEVNPEPKGGLKAFREWVGENYHYPQVAIDAGVKGRVVISFIVEADGQLSDFKIVEDLGYGTGEEAIKILKKAEAWRPGIQNGRKVRVAYTLPINMNLQK